MSYLKNILPALIFGVLFGFVVWYTSPPQTLTSGTITQILLFFIPLFLFLMFLLNIFLRFLIRGFVISLGIILLLIFKSLDMLNLVTIVLTILATIFITISFKKTRKEKAAKIQSLKLRKAQKL